MFLRQPSDFRSTHLVSSVPSLTESLDRLEIAVVRLEIAALAQRARLARAERRFKVLEFHGDATVAALDALIAGSKG
jgi:hypothetical protein